MDSLYWTSLNPKVKLKPTNKLFWNKYAFKVKLYAPCGNYLSSWLSHRYRDINAIQYINRRIHAEEKSSDYFLSQHIKNRILDRQERISIHKARPTVLEILKKAKLESDIQFRVEEPYISLYHEDEAVLQEVIQKLPKSCLQECLLEVSGILDSSHAEKLKPNVILNSKVEYKYKVFINLTANIRAHGPQILQYLETLGKENVHYTNSFKHELAVRGHAWHTVAYFYCNDVGIIDFINLICPNACSTKQVYRLVQKKHK